MFESPPYIECPKCHEIKFGVLSIGKYGYERRCALCGYPRGSKDISFYPLPEIKKRVIYLDQSILSLFMKALNPKAKKQSATPKIWKEIFSELHSLVKLQAVVCPDSSVHYAESIVYDFGQDVQRIYEMLSHKVTFLESDQLWFRQLRALFEGYCKGAPKESVSYDANEAVTGELNAWQGRLLVTVSLSRDQTLRDLYMRHKLHQHQRLVELFTRWQKPPKRKFNYWFEIEQKDALKIAKEKFSDGLAYFAKIQLAKDEDEAKNLVNNFFSSDFPACALTSRIEEALFAILAHKASDGMKAVKDEGVLNDFKVLGITLPYCDAVVVDRQTAGLLREIPKGFLSFRAQVFGVSEVEKILNYLKEIRRSLQREHIALVEEVYGAEWPAPYLTVFEDIDDNPEFK